MPLNLASIISNGRKLDMGGFKKVNLKIFKNAFYFFRYLDFFAIFKVIQDQNQFQP